jgi:hypothetical protein
VVVQVEVVLVVELLQAEREHLVKDLLVATVVHKIAGLLTPAVVVAVLVQ